MMKCYWLLKVIGGLVLVGLGSGCQPSIKERGGETGLLKVVVSIPPQAFFLEKIAGDRAEVEVLLPSGGNPHHYAPTPQQMKRLAQARVYFTIGVPFEEVLLAKIRRQLPYLQVVKTEEGLPLRTFSFHEEEEGGEGHSHDHGDGVDPHVWMSPRLVKKMARKMAVILAQMDPEGAMVYEENIKKFLEELDALDEQLKQRLGPWKGKKFFVYHPAFGYFADDYGLKQVALEVGGKGPSPKQLGQWMARAQEEGVKVIFIQAQFPQKSAQALAEALGGSVVRLDPLSRDYLKGLEDVASQVQGVLEKGKGVRK